MTFSMRFWPTFDSLLISLNSVAFGSLMACLVAKIFFIFMSSKARPTMTRNTAVTSKPIRITEFEVEEEASVDYEVIESLEVIAQALLDREYPEEQLTQTLVATHRLHWGMLQV